MDRFIFWWEFQLQNQIVFTMSHFLRKSVKCKLLLYFLLYALACDLMYMQQIYNISYLYNKDERRLCRFSYVGWSRRHNLEDVTRKITTSYEVHPYEMYRLVKVKHQRGHLFHCVGQIYKQFPPCHIGKINKDEGAMSSLMTRYFPFHFYVIHFLYCFRHLHSKEQRIQSSYS